MTPVASWSERGVSRGFAWKALLAVILAVMLAASLAPSHVDAKKMLGRHAVSGCTLQLDNQVGDRHYIGPRTFLAVRPVTFALFPEGYEIAPGFFCPGDAPNGFMAVPVFVDERVIRTERFGEKSFTMTATQVFDGQLIIGSEEYFCHVEQRLTAQGPLNPALSLHDPAQGAISLTGTWVITDGICGDMGLTGSGTLDWLGFPFLPTYDGQVNLLATPIHR